MRVCAGYLTLLPRNLGSLRLSRITSVFSSMFKSPSSTGPHRSRTPSNLSTRPPIHLSPRPAPSGLNHLGDILPQLRHRRIHLLSENIPEVAKGVHLSAHKLVTPTHKLDKLSRVDVRVAAVFDVFEELGRDRGEVVWGRGGGVEGAEGVGEGFPEMGVGL